MYEYTPQNQPALGKFTVCCTFSSVISKCQGLGTISRLQNTSHVRILISFTALLLHHLLQRLLNISSFIGTTFSISLCSCLTEVKSNNTYTSFEQPHNQQDTGFCRIHPAHLITNRIRDTRFDRLRLVHLIAYYRILDLIESIQSISYPTGYRIQGYWIESIQSVSEPTEYRFKGYNRFITMS